MDNNHLEILLNLLKKHGVTQFKNAQLELSIDPKFLSKVDAPTFPDTFSTPSLPIPDKLPTDTELLYWSSGFDESEVTSQPPSPDEAALKQ